MTSVRHEFEAIREDPEMMLYRWHGWASGTDALIATAATSALESQIAPRLQHELELLGQLDLSPVLKPISIAEFDSRLGLLFEDPGGKLLSASVGRPFSLQQFLSTAIGICGALDAVHTAGITHRDLRPANIFVTSNGQVRITGFGLASRLAREISSEDKFEISIAALPYMSPEQTGRVNRSIDQRSDLYSLGVVFYEMLVGAPPFSASSAKEWVHSHVARAPVPPGVRVENVPPILDQLVLKLLSKNAEDRYQTAAGVQHDLQRCLNHHIAGASYKNFSLAQKDVSDRLILPEKLYGRDGDIRALVDAFDNISSHPTFDFVLISGDPGIGKSSLVGDLRRAAYAVGALCASGKFDQFKRDIPYSTLSQAFGALLRQLLSLDEPQLSQWRSELGDALGSSGKIITDVFPELELIIGKQPEVPDVQPQEAHNRFHLVFARFLSVFASAGHPLLLFLDDLQWADSATLELLRRLACEEQLPHLLILGAYRKNEVGPEDDLRKLIEDVSKVRGGVLDIELRPLKASDVSSLLCAALKRDPAGAEPLVDLVYTRTSGNPFFAIQFINSLSTDGLLWFDRVRRRWEWDIDAVRRRAMTSNVAGLLAERLARYDTFTRNLAGKLAGLGDRAPVEFIGGLIGAPLSNVHAALRTLVADGLVSRVDETFAFVHDRVREAAYSLIEDDDRASLHLAIGRLLRERINTNSSEMDVFSVVDHFNRGLSHIDADDERLTVAELNLLAARRAKAGAAYDAAKAYLTTGMSILAKVDDERKNRLEFEVQSDLADCEFMIGDVEAAEGRLARLAGDSLSEADLVSVVRRQLSLHIYLGNFERAVQLSVDCLAKLGAPIPSKPSKRDLAREYAELMELVNKCRRNEILSLGDMTDERNILVSRALADLFVPAGTINSNLQYLAAVRLAKLGLRCGLTHETPVALSCLASQVSGWQLGTFQEGRLFGSVALDLVKTKGFDRYASRVYAVISGASGPWNMPLAECYRIAVKATEIGREQGGITYSSYAWGCALTALLDGGRSLAEVERQAEASLVILERLKFPLVSEFVVAQLMLVRALREPTHSLHTLSNQDFDEEKYEERMRGAPHLWHVLVRLRIRKLQLFVIAGNTGAALRLLPWLDRETRKLQVFELAEFHFYSAIVRARALKLGSYSSPAEAKQIRRKLLGSERKMRLWRRLCPENFDCRSELISAEVASVGERHLLAEQGYQRAIEAASSQGFQHIEALANELASQNFYTRGLLTARDAYLEQARRIYESWGAYAKVSQIDANRRAVTTIVRNPTDQLRQLDVTAAIDTYQALSREIVLDRLIERLMVTVVENAGASRGLLLLSRDDRLKIVAEATTSARGVNVVSRRPAHYAGELPESVLNYVSRTHEATIIDDAANANAHSGDPYLLRARPRSILCLPLVKQAQLVGVLYLENHLASGIFTTDRMVSLELIATQAAISIENAELFLAIQKQEDEVRQAGDEVRRSFDMIPALAWSASADGDLEFSNKQWHDFTGISPEETCGATWMQGFHPDDGEKISEKWRQLRRYKTSGEFEARMRRHDGSYRRFLVRLTPMCDPSGEVLKWHGTNTDIDDLKQAEEAQEALARVSRVTAMGALSVSIAHEINQPLMAIVTNAATCLRWLNADSPNIPEAKAAAERIVRDGHRAGDVVASIRAMARNAGRSGVVLRVGDMIDEVLQLTRNELDRHTISVATYVSDDAAFVFGDKTQIQQVLLNLVLNGSDAMAASNEGERCLTITAAPGESGFANVIVADTGIGLNERTRDRIFDPFFTTKEDGIGIGLSICRSIIESHGGRIWVTTNVPHGCSFHFALPITQELEV